MQGYGMIIIHEPLTHAAEMKAKAAALQSGITRPRGMNRAENMPLLTCINAASGRKAAKAGAAPSSPGSNAGLLSMASDGGEGSTNVTTAGMGKPGS